MKAIVIFLVLLAGNSAFAQTPFVVSDTVFPLGAISFGLSDDIALRNEKLPTFGLNTIYDRDDDGRRTIPLMAPSWKFEMFLAAPLRCEYIPSIKERRVCLFKSPTFRVVPTPFG